MFKKLKLKNGLTLILDQNKDVHTATATIYVNVGGNDVSFEVDGKKYNVEHGIAHLLEHYLIENSIYGNISEIFSDEFIKTNGGTSHKETCYYLSTVHHFKQNFIKLLNVVNNPNFTAEKLDAVKQPIIQEIRMYADKPNRLFDTTIMHNTLANEVLNITIGSEEKLEKISIADLRFYHEVFYRPGNQIITIAGNFPDDIVDIIEKEYQKFGFKNYIVKRNQVVEPKNVISQFQIVNDPSISENLFQIDYKIDLSNLTPLERDKVDYYFDYLFYDNYSEQSEFYSELVKDKLLTYSILYFFRPNLIENMLIFSLKVYANDYNEIIDRIKEKMNNLTSDQESFTRWKNNEIIIKIRDLEEIDYKVNNFKENLSLYNLEQVDSLEFVRNLNLDEYRELFKKIDFSNYAVLVNDVDNN